VYVCGIKRVGCAPQSIVHTLLLYRIQLLLLIIMLSPNAQEADLQDSTRDQNCTTGHSGYMILPAALFQKAPVNL
jgi:hypothetical protein